MSPRFLGVESYESFVFFDFEPKKVFGPPYSIGFMWVAQFMQFSSIFAMLALLATLGTPWYPEGRNWGCCDNVYVLGYKRMLFAASSFA